MQAAAALGRALAVNQNVSGRRRHYQNGCSLRVWVISIFDTELLSRSADINIGAVRPAAARHSGANGAVRRSTARSGPSARRPPCIYLINSELFNLIELEGKPGRCSSLSLILKRCEHLYSGLCAIKHRHPRDARITLQFYEQGNN